MGNITFYDSKGTPVAYSEDSQHIFLFSGEPVAYVSDDSVYAFSGKHLGRYGDGVIRDNNGDVVLFIDGETAGPMKPMKQMKPIKSLKQLKPLKGQRLLAPLKPLDRLSWSDIPSRTFFGVDVG